MRRFLADGSTNQAPGPLVGAPRSLVCTRTNRQRALVPAGAEVRSDAEASVSLPGVAIRREPSACHRLCAGRPRMIGVGEETYLAGMSSVSA